ncbi:hypothetical protein [Brevibacillus laterosporus]|uniref:Uncharacterized protein n=1 Tax=Brevibacillus laterosporus LMG 15441 TaxID=1042163 RepID=A0A075R8K9_BRELA|nr:hypothetical protein [Brevibacillus laterosporus]AIG25890.1 hypothetical protein BRLA_c015660 [Brevibacillus laterosporus LMG 15441]
MKKLVIVSVVFSSILSSFVFIDMDNCSEKEYASYQSIQVFFEDPGH